MQALTFEQVGVGLATISIVLAFYMNIRKLTLEQADKFAALTEMFNRVINDMNLTLTKLNTTLEYTGKETDRLGTRLTTHGKEIDEVRTTQAVNSATLVRHEERLNKLESKCHSHVMDKDISK